MYTHSSKATTMISLEGLPNSNNNTESIDTADMYASIKKESSESTVTNNVMVLNHYNLRLGSITDFETPHHQL